MDVWVWFEGRVWISVFYRVGLFLFGLTPEIFELGSHANFLKKLFGSVRFVLTFPFLKSFSWTNLCTEYCLLFFLKIRN